jgi:hypothetical protein
MKLFKLMAPILYILISFQFAGCAWENLPEGETEEQLIVEVTMRMAGAMRPELFYYIVFNITGDPEKKPYSVFEGEDRGKYWNVYYMWGTPPFEETGLWRGLGGTNAEGENRIDIPPTEQAYLTELRPGTTQEGDHLTLRIDLSDIGYDFTSINMNMIVCNQAIDAESRLEYQYDPLVYDSFFARGITINLDGTEDYWDENQPTNAQEIYPNEREDDAPPEADIVYWRFVIVSR